MLAQYKDIIYKDSATVKRVENKCLDYVLAAHRNVTKDEIIASIASGEVNDLNSDYYFALLMEEGQLLFDVAEKKFGRNLWRSDAWKNTKCKKRCPFGNICKKQLVQIEDELFCYGQLYYRKINEQIMISMANDKRIKILKPNGEVYIDLNCSEYDEQLLSEFFFKYKWFIWWLGDNGEYSGTKINGYNVISFL